MTRDFVVRGRLIFAGILVKYFKKIRQGMTAKYLSSIIEDVSEEV